MVRTYTTLVRTSVLLVTVLLFFLIGYAFLVRRLLGPCLRPYLNSMAPAGATAGLMAIAVYGLAKVAPFEGFALLVTQVLFGGLLYVVLNWVLYRERSVAMVQLALGRDA